MPFDSETHEARTNAEQSETPGDFRVSFESVVFEDLIADFIIEEGREPDIEEMFWMAGRIRRWNKLNAD